MADKAIYTVDTAENIKNNCKFYVNTSDNIEQADLYKLAPVLYKNLKLYAQMGTNLGSSYTTEQQNAVKNGTFEGINIGDYWIINDITWRVWDIDWYLGKGYPTACTSHHLVIIPDKVFSPIKKLYMSSPAKGYANTTYRGDERTNCENKIKEAFGDHILGHRELVTNGESTGYTWVDCTVELLSEVMLFGTSVFGGNYNVGTSCPQLELSKLNPKIVMSNNMYWLRDAASTAEWVYVPTTGGVMKASFTMPLPSGLRPYFLLS